MYENNLRKYLRLNNNFKQSLTYKWGDAGFYSEFNNMILCMLWCLQNRVKFSVYSKDYFSFNGIGYKYVFKESIPESKNNIINRYINSRALRAGNFGTRSDVHYRLAALYKAFSGNYLLSDVFQTARTMWFRKTEFDIPELNIKGDILSACQTLIQMVYQFNDYFENKIQTMISTLDIPENYIGIHIRGGDKIIERALLGVDEYIEKAKQITTIRNAFIMTDNYLLYEEIKNKYSDWSFFTLTFPYERGYDNNKSIKMPSEQKELELVKVFSSLRILSKSDAFIGTVSSNPGMFLGMIMPQDKVYYIDSPEWIIL